MASDGEPRWPGRPLLGTGVGTRQFAADHRELLPRHGQRLLDSVGMLGQITTAHEGMPAELQGEDFTRAVSLLQIAARRGQRHSRAAGRQRPPGGWHERAMARDLNDPIDTLSKASAISDSSVSTPASSPRGSPSRVATCRVSPST